MAKPVANIVGTGGLGVQLRDDWSLVLLPDQRLDALTQAILDNLRALGRYGRMFISGSEASVETAMEASAAAISAVEGKGAA